MRFNLEFHKILHGTDTNSQNALEINEHVWTETNEVVEGRAVKRAAPWQCRLPWSHKCKLFTDSSLDSQPILASTATAHLMIPGRSFAVNSQKRWTMSVLLYRWAVGGRGGHRFRCSSAVAPSPLRPTCRCITYANCFRSRLASFPIPLTTSSHNGRILPHFLQENWNFLPIVQHSSNLNEEISIVSSARSAGLSVSKSEPVKFRWVFAIEMEPIRSMADIHTMAMERSRHWLEDPEPEYITLHARWLPWNTHSHWLDAFNLLPSVLASPFPLIHFHPIPFFQLGEMCADLSLVSASP